MSRRLIFLVPMDAVKLTTLLEEGVITKEEHEQKQVKDYD